MGEGIISTELGAATGIAVNIQGKRYASINEPYKKMSEEMVIDHPADVNWRETRYERAKPHPLAYGDALEISRLKTRVKELESKVKEYEQMYA